jgi:hypothetical protein
MPTSLNAASGRGQIPLQPGRWPRFAYHAELTAKIVFGFCFTLTVAGLLANAALMLAGDDIVSIYPEMFLGP